MIDAARWGNEHSGVATAVSALILGGGLLLVGGGQLVALGRVVAAACVSVATEVSVAAAEAASGAVLSGNLTPLAIEGRLANAAKSGGNAVKLELDAIQAEVAAIRAGGVGNFLKFGGDEAVLHFDKHAGQIMKVTGKSAYNLKNYIDDANWIIQNGTYSSKLNGYYHFMGNATKGESLFGFVGLKNGDSTISTFHIKTATQLGLK